MIGRLLWYTALLGIAVVTTALQLDRQSASAPALSGTVPGPARGFAQAQIAARALQNSSPDDAIEQAKLLAERRPMPAESLRLLAQAQFAAGQTAQGSLTIQIAAQRGWRDPAAQEAMLRLALAAGDEAEAAKRYTALFLQNRTDDALLIEMGAAVFGARDNIASATLAGIVSGSDRWPDAFLLRGVRVLPTRAFVEIVSKAMSQDASFSCRALKSIIPSLSERDKMAGTRFEALVRNHC